VGFGLRRCRHEFEQQGQEIRQLVLQSASTDQIRAAARKQGMKSLAEDGWRLVRQGITTVEEVLSVTTAKEVAATTKTETGESATSIAVAR